MKMMMSLALPELDELNGECQLNSLIEIKETGGSKGVFAKADLEAKAVIIKLNGVYSTRPSRYSVQIGLERHLNLAANQEIVDETDFFWKYLNHSCAPSGYIDTQDCTYRALRKLRKGEELTFNYLTTEEEMAAPFACGCGSIKCFGVIKGYRHLSAEQKAELSPSVAAYLRS